MSNYFNNKNNPLLDSVKSVMIQNEKLRKIEESLNNELGITSKKALPHELHAEYDAAYNQMVNEALHPNQQKLDVHEPEKDELTKADFDKLRAMKEENIEEAAKSKRQQRFMALALKMRKGESDIGGRDVARAAADMSEKELKKFAKTKHEGLPEKVEKKKMSEDTLYEQWKKIGKGKYSHPSQGTFEYTEHKDGWTSWQHKPTNSITSMSGQDPHNEVKRRMKRLGIKEEAADIDTVLEEIAANLYAEYEYVCENYDDDDIQSYIDSLSDEQYEILEAVSDRDIMNDARYKANVKAAGGEKGARRMKVGASVDIGGGKTTKLGKGQSTIWAAIKNAKAIEDIAAKNAARKASMKTLSPAQKAAAAAVTSKKPLAQNKDAGLSGGKADPKGPEMSPKPIAKTPVELTKPIPPFGANERPVPTTVEKPNSEKVVSGATAPVPAGGFSQKAPAASFNDRFGGPPASSTTSASGTNLALTPMAVRNAARNAGVGSK